MTYPYDGENHIYLDKNQPFDFGYVLRGFKNGKYKIIALIDECGSQTLVDAWNESKWGPKGKGWSFDCAKIVSVNVEGEPTSSRLRAELLEYLSEFSTDPEVERRLNEIECVGHKEISSR